MKNDPPAGSKIKVEQYQDATTYSWSDQTKKATKWRDALRAVLLTGFSTLFLIFAFYHPPDNSGRWQGWPLVILLAFTVPGILGGLVFLRFALKPARPYKLILRPGYVEYKIGERSINSFGTDPQRAVNGLADLMKKYRKLVSKIDVSKITNLALETIGDRKRLSFDYAAERIEIGETLSDPEREWLYEILREHTRRK